MVSRVVAAMSTPFVKDSFCCNTSFAVLSVFPDDGIGLLSEQSFSRGAETVSPFLWEGSGGSDTSATNLSSSCTG